MLKKLKQKRNPSSNTFQEIISNWKNESTDLLFKTRLLQIEEERGSFITFFKSTSLLLLKKSSASQVGCQRKGTKLMFLSRCLWSLLFH